MGEIPAASVAAYTHAQRRAGAPTGSRCGTTAAAVMATKWRRARTGDGPRGGGAMNPVPRLRASFGFRCEMFLSARLNLALFESKTRSKQEPENSHPLLVGNKPEPVRDRTFWFWFRPQIEHGF